MKVEPLKKLIILQGVGASGKSSTLHLLTKMLKENGYQHLQIEKDHLNPVDIFQNGSCFIGIVSQEISEDLTINASFACWRDKCHILIGSSGSEHQCIDQYVQFEGYATEVILKTFTSNIKFELRVNEADASHLLSRINAYNYPPAW